MHTSVCVCVIEMNQREHLIYLSDCCVTMITPNGCHYNKWPDYSNSVWKTYWSSNKRRCVWHCVMFIKAFLVEWTKKEAQGIIFFSCLSKPGGLFRYHETSVKGYLAEVSISRVSVCHDGKLIKSLLKQKYPYNLKILIYM